MLVGGLRQSTLFKLSVFGSCGFLAFSPTGRDRGLGEHMFNTTCPLFHPLPSAILSSFPQTYFWLITFLSIFLFPHPFFLHSLSSSFLPFVFFLSPLCTSQFPCPSFHPLCTPLPCHYPGPPRESSERA